MKKKWQYYEQNKELVKQISEKHNISTLLAQILINRNIVDDSQIDIFLQPKRNDFHDPFLMLDMEKATDRIMQAIKNKEKTIISVENCTREDEKVIEGFSEDKPYLTTTIIKF